MAGQDQQDKPPQLEHRSRAQPVINQEARDRIYTEDANGDAGSNWSDSGRDSDLPSESHKPLRRHAASAQNSDRRHPQVRLQDQNKSQHETSSNATGPGYPSHKTGAVSQATQYGGYSNPFAHPQPTSKQYASNPHPSNQYPHPSNQYPRPSNQYPHPSNEYPHPSNQYPHSSYPAEAYPTGLYNNNNVPYPPNYFQGMPPPQSTYGYPPGGNPYPGNAYFMNLYSPQLPPAPPYEAISSTQPSQPIASPSPVEYELERNRKAQDEIKTKRHMARKEEQERQKAERKQEEAAARRERNKKHMDKLWRHIERQAKSEVNKSLHRNGVFKDCDTRSDPGGMLSNYDLRSFQSSRRQMQDGSGFRDEWRDTEPYQILEDLAQFLERQREQDGRRLYKGSARGSLDRSRIEAVSRALYGTMAEPALRTQIEDVVIDILQHLGLGDKDGNKDRLPLPPLPQRAVSDGYAASEGQQRAWDGQSDVSSTKMNDLSPLSSRHEPIHINNDQEPLLEFDQSVDLRQGYSASSNRPGQKQYLRKSREPRNNESAPGHFCNRDSQSQVSGEAVITKNTLTKTAQRARDTLSNIQLGGKDVRPMTAPDIQKQDKSRARLDNQAKPRGHRGFAYQEAYQGIILSDESDDSDSYSFRKPAPYIIPKDHPNLNVGNPPPATPDPPSC